jgi:RNA polymerase sigma factor (sigma-70 family)
MTLESQQLPTDEEFQELAKRAPDKALEIVMKALGSQLLGFLATQLPNRHEAEDCLQETMIRLMSDLQTYNGNLPVRQWVYLRAKWTAQKMRQRVARETAGRTAMAIQNSMRFSAEDMSRLMEVASTFISGLPESKRELLEKRLVLGWEHKEIAAERGLNPGAVRKACSRVIAEFARMLKEAGFDPDILDLQGENRLPEE